ncbi:MAG: NUDIX domain-containing protein [Candidatus Micrarchaeota archaeon]
MNSIKTESAFGAVIFREEEGKRLYLLVKNVRGEWGFPKGHPDKTKDKGPKDTALREIYEETNISKLEFIPGHKEELAYSYERAGEETAKISIYYLAKTEQAEVKCNDNEHSELKWLPFKKAMELLSFPSTKEILEKAEKRMTEGI